MATQLQIRRGTSTQVAAFTGAEGEIVVNTTNDSVHVNDGSTAGGFEMARADLNNVSDTSLNAALTGNTVSALTITTLTLGATAITATGAELNILDGVTSTAAELNILDGVTSTAAELNILDGVTATATELNLLDGVTATTAELNYVDGVTSAIQTQLDAKAPLASPTFTGTVTVSGLTTTADVSFGDNDKAIFGAGDDLQIYHSGSASVISDEGTGNLLFQTNGTAIKLNKGASENMLVANVDGSVDLYYDDAKKLATTSTGIDVTGTVTADGLTVATSTDPASITLRQTGNTSGFILKNFDGDEAQLVNADNGPMVFKTNDTERLRIDSSGNAIFTKSGGAYLQLKDASAVRGAINVGTSDGLVFTTGSSFTERMRITSAGAVGIGRSPRVMLDVAGEVAIAHNATYGLRFYNQPQNNWSSIGNNQTSSSANLVFKDASGEAMRLNGNRHLLVGCTALPSGGAGGAGFEVGQSSGRTILQLGTTTTSAEAVARFYNPNGAIGSISLSGSSTAYNTSSDQRLKENIADADDAGSKVDAIQVRKFDWIADGSHQDYGMVAQELQAVAPEAVSASEDPDEMMGVDYSKLVPMLVKEIQSLRARVNALETE